MRGELCCCARGAVLLADHKGPPNKQTWQQWKLTKLEAKMQEYTRAALAGGASSPRRKFHTAPTALALSLSLTLYLSLLSLSLSQVMLRAAAPVAGLPFQ